MLITVILVAMGVCRVLIGLAPFVFPRLSARFLGVPASHDNATGRLMARLFGTRDIGLGVLTFWALQHPEMLPFALLFNAGIDLADVAAAAIPLLRRQRIDRVAWTSIALAGSAALAWTATFAAVV